MGEKTRKRIEENITPTFAKQTTIQTEIVHCSNARPTKSEEIELNKFHAQNWSVNLKIYHMTPNNRMLK